MSSSRSRRRNAAIQPVDTSNDTAFRSAERKWKNRNIEPNLSHAFTMEAVQWEINENHESGISADTRRGIWKDGHGNEIECTQIPLDENLVHLGQTEWKGKEKACDESVKNFAIIFPSLPGFVFLPRIVAPKLQRELIVECLTHTAEPNLTSLSPHYDLPQKGLWSLYSSGQSGTLIPSKPTKIGQPGRKRIDFEPIDSTNAKDALNRAQGLHSFPNQQIELEPASVQELLKKLRWTTIGYSYDWSTKSYDFEQGKTELPPLIYRSCRDIVQSIPWEKVFESERNGENPAADPVWKDWKDSYEPQAGIINFYQLKDTLTGHIDQSEVDAVRPLVSFSLGHSAIFLFGGATRDTAPFSILLQSGDGLIMSGEECRRNFHGVPRILANTLPDYLHPEAQLSEGEEIPNWNLFGKYLQQGARINVNVRSVF